MADLPHTVPGDVEPSGEALEPLRGTCIAFLVLTSAFFFLRMTSRLVIGRVPWGLDDASITLAWVLSIGVATCGLLQAEAENVGMSNEVILDPQRNKHILKIVFAIVQLVVAEYCFTRVSVFLLYLRLFRGRTIRITCWTFIVLLFMQWISFAIAGLNQCHPVRYFWERTIAGTCYDTDPFYRYTCIPNIIIDLCMVLIPIPSVWQLNATRLRKIGLTLIFCWSIVALVASIIRLKTYMDHTVKYFAPNFTVPLVEWLVIEPGLYFIAACLPTMHHLLSKAVPSPYYDRLEHALEHTQSKAGDYLNSSRAGNNLSQFESNSSHTRLKDPEIGYISRPGVTATAQGSQRDPSASSGSLSKDSGRMGRMDVEDAPRSGNPNMSRNLPPDDLRRLKMGEGIAVRTDIITQEEQIEKILGF